MNERVSEIHESKNDSVLYNTFPTIKHYLLISEIKASLIYVKQHRVESHLRGHGILRTLA